MRFYQGLLPAIIWDPKAGAPLVEFKQGVFDTEDEKIIALLHKRGYLVEEDVNELVRGGRVEHGGFEEQEPVDKDLPSGRPPMDNPEMAQGVKTQAGNIPGTGYTQLPPGPQVALGDSLPESESEDLAQSGSKTDPPPAHGSQKRTREKKQKRTIKRRDKK